MRSHFSQSRAARSFKTFTKEKTNIVINLKLNSKHVVVPRGMAWLSLARVERYYAIIL